VKSSSIEFLTSNCSSGGGASTDVTSSASKPAYLAMRIGCNYVKLVMSGSSVRSSLCIVARHLCMATRYKDYQIELRLHAPVLLLVVWLLTTIGLYHTARLFICRRLPFMYWQPPCKGTSISSCRNSRRQRS
jgi:hypothetical protein